MFYVPCSLFTPLYREKGSESPHIDMEKIDEKCAKYDKWSKGYLALHADTELRIHYPLPSEEDEG